MRSKGLNKGSLIGLTSSRSSSVSHQASTPNSGPPSSISLSCKKLFVQHIRQSLTRLVFLIFNLYLLGLFWLSIPALPSIYQENRPPLAPYRPKCNSILHLFGEWLFEAALIGGEAWIQHTKSNEKLNAHFNN